MNTSCRFSQAELLDTTLFLSRTALSLRPSPLSQGHPMMVGVQRFHKEPPPGAKDREAVRAGV